MGNSGKRTVFNYMQLAGDLLLVNIAIILAFLIRFGGDLPLYNFEPYMRMTPFITVLTVVIFNFYGLYHTQNKRWSEILASLVISVIILVVLTITLSYLIGGFSFPRSVFFIAALTQIFILGFWRRWMFVVEKKKAPQRRVICVAPADEASCLVNKIGPNYGKVLGVVTEGAESDSGDTNDSDDLNTQKNGGSRVLGSFEEARDICLQYSPDLLIISGKVPDHIKESMVRGSMKYNWEVFVVPGVYEIMLSQTDVDQLEDTPVLKIDSRKNPEGDQVKRFMDCLLSALALLVFSPIMALIALAIKLDSSGPFLYVQERVSMLGRRFMLYKFRTMKDHAEDSTGPVLSGNGDDRITRVGSFLRASRLDELPQLINVLKGDMSLVGPRPERPYFAQQFEKDIPGYSYRHMTKAGMTGLAQVMSNYSTSTEDKLRYDLLYTKNRSPLFDIKILLQTMKVILMKNRAS